ncbi:hypothetical protein GI374_09110 [Paracoccus sp. S-4012]|uniref:hypothetical protein n=1 Tax=Paracoccus sp. S-4012 TaxID=2665648 RepID=UPI0012B0996B|nr:hypothetical protein [Paracoccus sp. S-4012]MRX50601.1 hypothetical protein [Paracoccus sp. S-4012]
MGGNCRQRSQVAGGVIGLFVLMWLVTIGGMSLLAALVLGILAWVLITGLLVWGVCEGRGGAEEHSAILAADWRSEPFVPTRRVVKPGGDVSEEGPLNPIARVPPGPPLERVTMARGDEPVRIGEGVRAMQSADGTATGGAQGAAATSKQDATTSQVPAGGEPEPAAMTRSPALSAQGDPARGAPEQNVRSGDVSVEGNPDQLSDNMPQVPMRHADSASEQAALESSGMAPPSADSEAGADGGPEGHIVPLERRDEAGAGTGDDLTRIRGVGPMARDWFADNGITRFSQIAAWSDADITRVSAMMGPLGQRIRREDWVGQARRLAGGGDLAP